MYNEKQINILTRFFPMAFFSTRKDIRIMFFSFAVLHDNVTKYSTEEQFRSRL